MIVIDSHDFCTKVYDNTQHVHVMYNQNELMQLRCKDLQGQPCQSRNQNGLTRYQDKGHKPEPRLLDYLQSKLTYAATLIQVFMCRIEFTHFVIEMDPHDFEALHTVASS